MSESGYDIKAFTDEQRERLAKDLNAEAYRVLLDHGTEAPFCGTLLDNKQEGTYACRLCGLPLFTSKHKFESGPAGRRFIRRSTRNISKISTTTATECGEQRFAVPVATDIKGMCSPMVRRRAANDTA